MADDRRRHGDGDRQPRPTDLRFTFDTAGVTIGFAGTVRGGEIAGMLAEGATGGTVEALGRLRGALRDAPWAAMPPDRSRYYEP